MEAQEFTKKRVEVVNSRMSERSKRTLKHFGYDNSIGEVISTKNNIDAFNKIGHVISTMGISEKYKTRIVFDYDPSFEHCLLQIIQTE